MHEADSRQQTADSRLPCNWHYLIHMNLRVCKAPKSEGKNGAAVLGCWESQQIASATVVAVQPTL